MRARISSTILIASLLALALSGCGGGGSTGSTGGTGDGGGGGGGGTPSLAISALGPSGVMVEAPIYTVTVLGQGFNGSSQVFIDGQPAVNTTYLDSGTVQAQVDNSVTDNVKSVPLSHSFQRNHKLVAGQFGSEPNAPVVAAKCNEMQFPRLLIALQSPRHEARL